MQLDVASFSPRSKGVKCMTDEIEYSIFADRNAWRAWLEANHQIASEAWLLHYKKRFQGPAVSLDEAVEEALCFGWIDGALRPRDEQTYLHRYSPRRPDSVWSIHNIARVEALMRSGLMTPAGLEKIDEAKANGQWEAARRREEVDIIPPDLDAALRTRPGALAAYRALTTSRKKQLIYWLQTAKRPETQARRIKAILTEVTGTIHEDLGSPGNKKNPEGPEEGDRS